jgi:hypothetical protein
MGANIPPPPPGFTLDKPKERTPPPAGFKLDQSGGAATQEPGGGLEALWHGLVRGGRDVLEGGAQIGARMGEATDTGFGPELPPGTTQRVNQAAQQSAAAYEADPTRQAHPYMAGAGRIAGNVAATVPLAAITPGAGASSAAGLIGRGALAGAAGAAMQPVDPKKQDYWQEKAKQLGLGAAGGAILPAAGSAIAPRLPSPQAIASAFRPIASFLRGGEERTINGFNRTVARQVLDPIDGKITQNLSGHALANSVEDQLGKAYDKVLPHLSMSRDAVIGAASDDTKQLVSELDPLEGTQFERIITNRVLKKIPESGMLKGEEFKKVEHDLSSRAMSFLGTQKDELGKALLHTVSDLRDSLAKENPIYAPELSRVNEAWKMWTRMRQAAGGATKYGTFTPADLLRAIRTQDPTVGRSAFVNGDGVLQKYAEVAEKALGQRSSPWELLHLFSGHGLPMAAARAATGPIARGAKRLTPYAAPGIGTQAPQVGDTGPQGGEITDVQSRRLP